MSQDSMAASVAGPSSKRNSRDVEVDSSLKKSGTLEDYVRDISESIIKRLERRLRHEQELDLAVQILRNDGICEGSDLFCKALWLCKDALDRLAFMTMQTKEGRLNWINFNWEYRMSGGKGAKDEESNNSDTSSDGSSIIYLAGLGAAVAAYAASRNCGVSTSPVSAAEQDQASTDGPEAVKPRRSSRAKKASTRVTGPDWV